MLSRATTEAEVYNLFSQYGRVLEFCLLVNKVTGQSKGHGFVKFEKKEDAINAINALNDRYRDKVNTGTQTVLQVLDILTEVFKLNKKKNFSLTVLIPPNY